MLFVDYNDEVKDKTRYVVVLEKGPTSWGAQVRDFPGCFAVGDSREEVLSLIREAIEFQIEGLREDGEPIPEPRRNPRSVTRADLRIEEPQAGRRVGVALHGRLHVE